MMNTVLNVNDVSGLTIEDKANLAKLVSVYEKHFTKNAEKTKYYEGKISLSEVNLGLALPRGIRGLEIGCAWGGKTVDVLAARSRFDGFVGSDGETVDVLNQIMEDNNLLAEYQKACSDELKYGCTFATLNKTEDGKPSIKFHSPCTAAALWDGAKGRVSCGFAIIDTRKDNSDSNWTPSIIHYYTDTCVWELVKDSQGRWLATGHPHKMGRPLIEPLIWNSSSAKPFGQSRIKEPIRRLIQGYVRTIANATIGLEFATAPQKYLLGVTDDQYDVLINQSFKQYVGSIMAGTTNPETGEKPTFGQLPQGNIEPHVQMMRVLATQFSAATGLSITDTGVVNDANPSSSDAILAQSQTLILLAEQLNAGNGNALRTIAQMALAMSQNVALNELGDEDKDIIAHFKNPAMPSVAVTADAAIKIASARPNFATTDTFLEMIGFSQADIRRIKEQETRARGQQVLTEFGE